MENKSKDEYIIENKTNLNEPSVCSSPSLDEVNEITLRSPRREELENYGKENFGFVLEAKPNNQNFAIVSQSENRSWFFTILNNIKLFIFRFFGVKP